MDLQNISKENLFIKLQYNLIVLLVGFQSWLPVAVGALSWVQRREQDGRHYAGP